MLRPLLWWMSAGAVMAMVLAKAWPERGWRRAWGTYLVMLMVWWLNLYIPDSGTARPWAGPWRAQVVDADTQQPLAGVVVVAWWQKCCIDPNPSDYYASQEVVTGPDGRFEIAARPWAFPLFPFLSFFEGPGFAAFKPGYGSLRPHGFLEAELLSPKEQYARRSQFSHAWERGGEVLFELPQLKTKEDWQMYRGTPGVPPGKTPRWDEAIQKEQRPRQWR